MCEISGISFNAALLPFMSTPKVKGYRRDDGPGFDWHLINCTYLYHGNGNVN